MAKYVGLIPRRVASRRLPTTPFSSYFFDKFCKYSTTAISEILFAPSDMQLMDNDAIRAEN
ncbi:hypothetical protein CVT25_002367 [Psilocybe cyanescens]|uniref:Uncharacterized protein n=1 Tax=Psilocybe cyanescens TaxID=93625 RepID=A0A409WKL6_PSICY|nr:hypothetical protein CVT25_002367 [Psilocybe cyanescens]